MSRLSGMVFNGKNWKSTKQALAGLGTRFKPIKKTKLVCKDGPLSNHNLYLTTSGTMPFTLNGQTGRYNSKMEWEPIAK